MERSRVIMEFLTIDIDVMIHMPSIGKRTSQLGV